VSFGLIQKEIATVIRHGPQMTTKRIRNIMDKIIAKTATKAEREEFEAARRVENLRQRCHAAVNDRDEIISRLPLPTMLHDVPIYWPGQRPGK